MQRCVNINHPEFKELLEQSGLDPISLAADISIWQDRNDTDLFPTLNQLNGRSEVQYQKPADEGIVASEKTIRDLTASVADRIGMSYRIISDRNQKFKGKIEGDTAIVNLAYATLDTPIHEILGHPIIRTLKGTPELRVGDKVTYSTILGDRTSTIKTFSKVTGLAELEDGSEFQGYELTKIQSPLYNNLLKELEYGRGKEVLDRIKRDYTYKYGDKEDALDEKWSSVNSNRPKYTLEEQQEEAIVELLGMMTAERLDAVKDGKLISLLKRLLKEIKTFVKNLLRQREVEIDKLPDSMTIGDLADILAYSNSKLILPGNEVVYTTPDNQTFKTYAEASSHISELAKNAQDVDLKLDSVPITIKTLTNVNEIPVSSFEYYESIFPKQLIKKYNKWYKLDIDLEDGSDDYIEVTDQFVLDKWNEKTLDPATPNDKLKQKFLSTYKGFLNAGILNDRQKEYYTDLNTNESKFFGKEDFKIDDILVARSATKYYALHTEDLEPIEIDQDKFLKMLVASKPSIESFVQKNKEYEMSKEIIEEWMRVNNIRYNPEEIYSRGQEFVSIVGAYSSFDVNLMMQNLLQHIEDNQKAGGEFAVSAITKPVDRKIGHLEGGGGKIRFKIYPQPHDILWAANADVYSGSVWDAGEKINKDKKSELLGVTYSKYPALGNLKSVKPNLAEIVDDLDHHHNELGIALTGSNFRLDYDDNIPYQTKKIIDSINRILDQKYGKLRKPEIKKKTERKWRVIYKGTSTVYETFDSQEKAQEWFNKFNVSLRKGTEIEEFESPLQPKLTSKDLKESINDVKRRIDSSKEYTEQALVNTKVAKLKEVAKKYPRALIRSEVRPINNTDYNSNLFDDDFDLPFQKIPSKKPELSDTKLKSLLERTGFSLVTLAEYEELKGKKFNVNALVDMTARLVAMADGASTSALTEEISHIAVAQSRGTTEYNTAMKLLDQTDEYAEFYNQYMQEYNNDQYVREEILGKILMSDLEMKLGNSIGMWLRRLWNKFLSIFRNNDLRSYVSRITDEFIANPNREIKGEGVFFQMGEEEKTLQQQVNKLNRRYKDLAKRQKSNPSLLFQIKALEEELEGNKNGVGIYKFLQLLNDDTKNAIDFIKEYFTVTEKDSKIYLGSRGTKEAPSDKMTHQLAMYIGYYLPFLKELNMVLDEDSVIGDGRKKVLDKMIRLHVENFEVINRAYNQFLRENNNESTEAKELDIAGQRIMTPNELREAPRDSNFLETWFGLARNNSDTLVRLAHRTISDIKNKIRRAVLNWSDDFLGNAIDYIGKDMSWVAERVTVQIKDKNGNVTTKVQKSGNFIDEVHQGQWELAREQFHTSLHDRYGFSQDFAERLKQKKIIQGYGEGADAFQKAEIQKLKEYNKEIAQWYTANSIPNPKKDQIIAERKAALSPEQFEFWKMRNMETNLDGSVRYYKGELVSPSRGKTKTIEFGGQVKKIKTTDWTNHDYFKLSDKDKTFLQYLKDQKKAIDKSIPFADSNRLPQMYESTLDIMRLNEPEVFKRLGKNIKSSIVREEDDTQFVDTVQLNDGTILDDVPIRFTSLLSEPDRVTTDILSSLIAYKQMQENYVQMSAQLPMFENWLQGAKRRVVKSGNKVIRGEDSWSFDALRKFLEVHVSGKEKEDLSVNILGTQVSITKAVEKLSQWVRMKNLGFNFITMTSNLISSKVFATLESIVGNYTTVKSSAFANKEFFSILPTVMSSFNGVRSTDRISSLMTYFGLGRDIREMFDDLDKHVLMRNQPDKTLMYGYEKGDYFTKSVVMIAILDNYRVHDNKWYTKREADKAGLNFDTMTSAYNMLKTDKDGKVNHTIPESVIDNLTARMRTIASRVDGSLSPEDKGAIYQHAVFNMVGLHRGWLFEGLSRRLKSKGYDFTLNQITEGEYRTVMDLIGRFFMSKQKIQVLKNLLAKYNELEDYQKENLKRVMLELSMIAAFTIIALALNSGDDDEEDYFRDLLAYQSNRLLLEVSSFYNPNEFVSAIKDPIVPARDLELVTNFTDMFNTEIIEKGKWEGMTKQQKYLLQLVPGVKGYTVFKDPEGQNDFLKHKPLKVVYSTYEFFVPEEDNEK